MSAPAPPPHFVAYLRVSIGGQGRSGLGLEARRAAVAAHAARGRIVSEFVEEEARIISARTRAALAAAKARGVWLGSPRLLARCPVLAARVNAARVENVRRRAAAVLPYVALVQGARSVGPTAAEPSRSRAYRSSTVPPVATASRRRATGSGTGRPTRPA